MQINVKMSIIIVLLLFIGVLVGVATKNFQRSIHTGLNRSRIATIQYAIGDYLSTANQPSESSLTTYIMQKYPQIEVASNTILDYHKTAVRYVTEKREEGIFVGVYSAGSDRLWGTQDDIKREGTLVLDIAPRKDQTNQALKKMK